MIYRYKNARTWQVISVPCKVNGKNWILVETKADPVEKPSTGKPKTTRKRS